MAGWQRCDAMSGQTENNRLDDVKKQFGKT